MRTIYIIMDYKNTTISVTIQLESSLSLRGKYEATQKVDDKGNKVFEVWRNKIDNSIERLPVFNLKTTQLPKYHNCQLNTTLNEQFCAWAVSDDARPKKTVSVPWWNKLSKTNRLKMAVAQYVADLYGQNAEYSFQILGE